MLDKKLVDYISSKSKIKNTALVEKDIILQLFLIELAANNYFSTNYAFKGGTCLVKCYFGYYRFSEDLDFTFTDQDKFKNRSKKETSRLLGAERDCLLNLILQISKKYNLDFKAAKTDKTYIEYGASKRFITVKVWYISSVTNEKQFIKLQFNFIESFRYNCIKKQAQPLLKNIDKKEISFLFPEYKQLLDVPTVLTYDLKEIVAEKIRAILTRRGVKERDFMDVFIILRKLNKNPIEFKDVVIEKTKFMLKYKKYTQNLKNKLDSAEWYSQNKDNYLLLNEIPEGFDLFLKRFNPFLSEIGNEILKNMKKPLE
ncbi:nucleotidyl transferase AbiEii/AbiGii toxin family protein [Candidatus Woesearchaeota archaeon]|nr:nucleotidyl transferase AbiEii/AbiGii toxin family protein [Candidatus Woesearchaeota archaeon]